MRSPHSKKMDLFYSKSSRKGLSHSESFRREAFVENFFRRVSHRVFVTVDVSDNNNSSLQGKLTRRSWWPGYSTVSLSNSE